MIKRLYSQKGVSLFSDSDFRITKVDLHSADGKVLASYADMEVPAQWSQTACDILVLKYFRHSGVPAECTPVLEKGLPEFLSPSIPVKGTEFHGERSVRQVFHRLAGCWCYWGWKAGYFDSEADAETCYDELQAMLFYQCAAPNSPQWFNTGLHWAYGISGPPQGHFAYDLDSDSILPCDSAYRRPQPHACFIQSVDDNLLEDDGIVSLWEKETRLFKYGSGSGTNFSRIRGKDEPLSGGGHSSGLLSFLHVSDTVAGAIKSGGTTRRAAKMVLLDIDHPEIEAFIRWKLDAEYTVASMIAGSNMLTLCLERLYESHSSESPHNTEKDRRLALQRARVARIPESTILQIILLAEHGRPLPTFPAYTGDWEGKAYQMVQGQHSNNSVRIPDSFMIAKEEDKEHHLLARTTKTCVRTLSSKALWEEIGFAAWACADPGVQYHDTINRWNTCPHDGEIRASNPCAEYMFLDDTACNLASLNLLAFLTEDGDIDVRKLIHATKLWTIVLDISVTMAAYPSEKIARQSLNYRTLGLGISNGGGLLMECAIPYGSKKGRALLAGIMCLITAASYHCSAQLAQRLACYPRFKDNKKPHLAVIERHIEASLGNKRSFEQETCPTLLDRSLLSDSLCTALDSQWKAARNLGKKHGFRNAQTSCIAPTGTISLVMDCDTTGIEPDYALVKVKKLAGGHYIRLVNSRVPGALKRLGYTQKQIDDIVVFICGTGSLKDAPGLSLEILAKKGVPADELERLEQILPSSVHLRLAMTAALPSLYQDSEEDPLEALCTPEELEAASLFACGHLSIEGAPHIKAQHLSVFACANPLLPGNASVLDARDHVLMLASLQPFVSGAISKTINVPETASVDDVLSVYQLAWETGIKALSVYRDGSKISQPLMSSFPQKDLVHGTLKELLFSGSHRRKLPPKRLGYTQKASIGGQKIYLRTGEYDDGTLGEIFIDIHKEGASFRSLMNHFAIAVSMGLQYGVPLEEFVEAFIHTRFEPNGLVYDHEYIKSASSITDYIVKDLALAYLNRYDLVPGTPEAAEAPGDSAKRRKESPGGDCCPLCGNFTLIRAGSCLYCKECGHSTGCS